MKPPLFHHSRPAPQAKFLRPEPSTRWNPSFFTAYGAQTRADAVGAAYYGLAPRARAAEGFGCGKGVKAKSRTVILPLPGRWSLVPALVGLQYGFK